MARNRVKVELNLPGINAVMKSPGVQAHLQAAGEHVAALAGEISGGEKFGARTHQADWIAVTNVYPDSREAAKANAEDNVLLKALGASGLKLSK